MLTAAIFHIALSLSPQPALVLVQGRSADADLGASASERSSGGGQSGGNDRGNRAGEDRGSKSQRTAQSEKTGPRNDGRAKSPKPKPDMSWTEAKYGVGDRLHETFVLKSFYPGLDLPDLPGDEAYYRGDENVYRVNKKTLKVLEVIPIGTVVLY